MRWHTLIFENVRGYYGYDAQRRADLLFGFFMLMRESGEGRLISVADLTRSVEWFPDKEWLAFLPEFLVRRINYLQVPERVSIEKIISLLRRYILQPGAPVSVYTLPWPKIVGVEKDYVKIDLDGATAYARVGVIYDWPIRREENLFLSAILLPADLSGVEGGEQYSGIPLTDTVIVNWRRVPISKARQAINKFVAFIQSTINEAPDSELADIFRRVYGSVLANPAIFRESITSIHGVDAIMEVGIRLIFYSRDLDDLMRRTELAAAYLREIGIGIDFPSYVQHLLFDPEYRVAEKLYMNAAAASQLAPFIYDMVMEDEGIPLGVSLSAQPIIINPYKRRPSTMLIVGGPASGKSTYLALTVYRLIASRPTENIGVYGLDVSGNLAVLQRLGIRYMTVGVEEDQPGFDPVGLDMPIRDKAELITRLLIQENPEYERRRGAIKMMIMQTLERHPAENLTALARNIIAEKDAEIGRAIERLRDSYGSLLNEPASGEYETLILDLSKLHFREQQLPLVRELALRYLWHRVIGRGGGRPSVFFIDDYDKLELENEEFRNFMRTLLTSSTAYNALVIFTATSMDQLFGERITRSPHWVFSSVKVFLPHPDADRLEDAGYSKEAIDHIRRGGGGEGAPLVVDARDVRMLGYVAVGGHEKDMLGLR